MAPRRTSNRVWTSSVSAATFFVKSIRVGFGYKYLIYSVKIRICVNEWEVSTLSRLSMSRCLRGSQRRHQAGRVIQIHRRHLLLSLHVLIPANPRRGATSPNISYHHISTPPSIHDNPTSDYYPSYLTTPCQNAHSQTPPSSSS